MTGLRRVTSVAVLCLGAGAAWGQSDTPAPIVQPGAPGQSSKDPFARHCRHSTPKAVGG